MYRALEIPEIVRMILSLCYHQETLAHCARVCRLWKEPALDMLWRCVHDPRKLLSILSPLIKVPASEHDQDASEVELCQWERFAAIPRSRDWERFMTYSRRVRKISFDGDDSTLLSQELMLHVSLANKKPLLPNLEALVWVAPQHASSLFFSITLIPPSLRYLQVVFPYSTPSFPTSCISAFLDLVRVSAPSLIEFELLIIWQFPPEVYAEALVELLECLPNLRAVKLSSMTFVPEVVEALAKLPHLERVEYHPEYRECTLSHPSLAPPPLGMRLGSFPGLRTLATPLSSIIDFVSMADRRLEILHSLEIQAISHTDNTKDLFHTLPLVCPNLTILKLRFCQRGRTINLDVLRPLLDIPQIKEFYLSDDSTCNISDTDIGEISKKWPLLEVLHLNEDSTPKPSKISLSALIPLAQNCRHLYRLGLYMNDGVPVLNGTPTPFGRLETLCVGNSVVAKPAKTASFLSELCHGPLHILGATEILWNFTANFADEEYLKLYLEKVQWHQWKLVEIIHEELRLARVKALEELGEVRSRVLHLEIYIRDHGLEV